VFCTIVHILFCLEQLPSSLTKRRAFWWEQTRGSSIWLPLSTRPRYLVSIQRSSRVHGQYSVLVPGTWPLFCARSGYLATVQYSSQVPSPYFALTPDTCPLLILDNCPLIGTRPKYLASTKFLFQGYYTFLLPGTWP
jgi:hypothetical protein